MRRIFPALALLLAACHPSPRELAIDVSPGQEKDAFTADPPIDSVEVKITSVDGSVKIKTSAKPGGTFDLGTITSDQQITVEVTGTDASGAVRLRGRTLAAIAIDSIEENLTVFAQRVGRWARPPGGLPATHLGGAAAVVSERYLMVTGGATGEGVDPAGVDSYDLGELGGSTSNAFGTTATTLVSIGESVLVIGPKSAAWVSFADNSSGAAAWPSDDDSFADVAGGQVIAGSGRQYVVGATRPGTATRAVLEVADDGSLAAYRLVTARSGAAAAWIDGVGLVVAGGSADGSGLELLADGGTKFASTAYPPDPVTGAGAVTDGNKGVVLVGGLSASAPAPTRHLDPRCVTDCAATEIAGAALPAGLGGVSAYSLGGSSTIAVGVDAASGLTRTFLVDAGKPSVSEVELREPRKGATPLPAPNGTLALLGGVHPDGTAATSIETFFPE